MVDRGHFSLNIGIQQLVTGLFELFCFKTFVR